MMNNIKIERPGLRNIKTVVSVLICLIICGMFNRNPLLSAVAAILTIENSMDKTIDTGINRIFATIFGGIIGTIVMCFLYVINNEYSVMIFIPFGIFIIIYICSKIMKRSEFITIACVAFLSVNFENSSENLDIMYAVTRTCDTLIGVIVGMFVNLYNPKKRK